MLLSKDVLFIREEILVPRSFKSAGSSGSYKRGVGSFSFHHHFKLFKSSLTNASSDLLVGYSIFMNDIRLTL